MHPLLPSWRAVADNFLRQLPDIDPAETQEWIDSLDAIIAAGGRERARYIVAKLLERSNEQRVGVPPTTSTPYINTIPASEQPFFPGNEQVERRIRRFIRWNAAAMVIRANKTADGIGGHLSTFASSASLYEVGFNHFFKGKDDGLVGDHIYFQGHAAPGVYARAYLEGRLSEQELDNFRMEVGGNGLSGYPHPRLMPDFWEYPTVSMGLGPINSIYHARFNRYMHNRRIDDTAQSTVWCFLGDGECDEPETLGAIALAGRNDLDNLKWVVNCNLQRLDGPVRGNGKIIQELEGVFRGAGWNVIKVIWGTRWDELLMRDTDGALLNKMATTVDGEYQRYAVETGAYIREHFFGPDPRLRKLVTHLSDEDLRVLPRGGHDYQKVYAAFKAATEVKGQPTVILAKTIKGWTLGEGFEGRNATHQIKKMTTTQLMELRSRLHMENEIDEADLADGIPPYYRPPADSEEIRYMMDRRRALDGAVPRRVVRDRRPITLPADGPFIDMRKGSGGREVSTTMAFTALLRDLMRDQHFGRRVVPIVPDEARTFGMDSLFREFRIYAPHGQLYEPVDHDLLLSYSESTDGQILEEGITECGSLASWLAAATSYANLGVPMVPFYAFYSMFGFQRVGDSIWAAADARARGFLIGATAGRTTLLGEGLQHQDGHSHVLASTVPPCESYDPAFAYELGAIVDEGLHRMYPPDTADGSDVFYYITIYNENYEQPPRPDHVTDSDITGGLYKFDDGPGSRKRSATILFSGASVGAALEAQALLAEHHDTSAELWSATSYQRLRREALDVERRNRLHPTDEPAVPLVTRRLSDSDGPIVAVTDFMTLVPDQIARFTPRPLHVLGTDGFGRSDTREALRRFFEVDGVHIVLAVLSALMESGEASADEVAAAIDRYGIDVDRDDPGHPDTGARLSSDG
ncbi:MAG: pyruvate dehydrogenase (acetyl-transferring), homodimeric type [Acidimicrobiaceae bacterium]|nr:pyruvate dehydrogenase (acetyl-transferring), homodimeric type [Acidimicrobiaceae bacterium]MYF43079.1 pyruvate dehydrogenase (acetyl-transferring), homodimeric type [Acidimicrobiaceae bacterium]MYJ36118.1 pyruvate dehydrogenase (acetyl-transferring), homodimeric type [Acidimicrobiaceae bacterium]